MSNDARTDNQKFNTPTPGVRPQTPQRPTHPSAPKQDKVESSNDNASQTKGTLTEVLFAAALKYYGVDAKTDHKDGETVFTWGEGEGDNKVTRKVTVSSDSSFVTSVEKGNTVHNVTFNNKQDAQNVFAKAFDLLKNGNVTEK